MKRGVYDCIERERDAVFFPFVFFSNNPFLLRFFSVLLFVVFFFTSATEPKTGRSR